MKLKRLVEWMDTLSPRKRKLFNKIIKLLENLIIKIPAVKDKIKKEVENNLKILEEKENEKVKYFQKGFERIPTDGLSSEEIMRITDYDKTVLKLKNPDLVSGAIYFNNKELNGLNAEIYKRSTGSNTLHPDSARDIIHKERQILKMSSNLLGGGYGFVTSGGTESIALALMAYLKRSQINGNKKPEIIVPESAHFTYYRYADALGIKIKEIPVNNKGEVNISSLKKSLSRKTILIIGSAPSYPWGIMDPIKEMGRIAKDSKVGLHVDACLGGFFLPWVKKLGRNIPEFDLSVDGVTSLSADLHKYGYSPKGASIILYKHKDLATQQPYSRKDHMGGFYSVPTLLGSRPGHAIETAWATLLYIGEEGYKKLAHQILESADIIKYRVKNEIPEIYIPGDPLWIIAFMSKNIDMLHVADLMSKPSEGIKEGWGKLTWGLDRIRSGFHICLTPQNSKARLADMFVNKLKHAIMLSKKVKPKGLAAIYGMGEKMPIKSPMEEIMSKYMLMIRN